MIGHTEIILIVAVIVLLFGAAAIPKLAKSIGKAKSEFQKGLSEGKEEDSKEEKEISDKKK